MCEKKRIVKIYLINSEENAIFISLILFAYCIE